jgi:hypothetical protein
LSNEDKILEEVYSSFKERLPFEDFRNRLNSLKIDKWNFVRAILLHQQSVKCTTCNPNVGMVLLCSCADALQLVGEERSKANFMKFYLDYCPQSLRTPPIEYYPEGKPQPPPITAPFEKALHYIYKKFRCLYVHKGIGRLDIVPETEGITILPFPLMDKIKGENEVYLINLEKIPAWFEKVTIESLSAMLLETGQS